MAGKTWALAAAAGTISMTLIGGVALATFQAPVVAQPDPVQPAPLAVPDGQPRPDRLKATLDALVKKGTITQAQEDAILQAFKDAAPAAKPAPARPGSPTVKSFIGDLARTASAYLGLTEKELVARLRAGTSVAAIANSIPGKSSAELVTRLTTAATDRIDQAVATKKLTAEQGAALRSKLTAEIAAFVQRSGTARPAPRPHQAVKPTPSPKP